ncbi:MAG TPA: SMP-30/gluconolactonase/LRE family protein [Tepidisphaeraceae bacterium]|nr:SMP-30/gluconolactonase/LRE family protein [Tepidisphaeraceae bacterium]
MFAADTYQLGLDSQVQDVPHGKVTSGQIISHKAFPGVIHKYWVYVPAQYDGSTPAAVMVFQDGGGFQNPKGSFRVPVVFDNLIAHKQMPVTIAIMIDPGVLPPADPKTQSPRAERGFEYDSPTDRYARFLIDEVLPQVGEQFKLTTDPNLRAICGSSSGGICAFTAAWERPDQFHRVLSFVGSFTNLRGGNRYPDLIRKTEPKPLRVFLQDGTNDLNNFAGSWYLANQDMASALKWVGYETHLVIGTEGHNARQGGAIFPDALRWLWQDWEKPIATPSQLPKGSIGDILIAGQDWQPVGGPYTATSGATVDAEGNVYLSDVSASKIYKVNADGNESVWIDNSNGADGIRTGPDGKLYACQNRNKSVATFDLKTKQQEVIATGIDQANDLAVDHLGHVYATGSATKQVWYVSPDRQKRLADKGLEFPNGIGFTPDHSQLIVDDMRGVNIYTYSVEPDGTLKNKQPFYTAECPYGQFDSGADGLCLDREGRLYVTSRMGVQVFSPQGPILGIISKPQGMSLSSVILGGKDFDTLYVTCGTKGLTKNNLYNFS